MDRAEKYAAIHRYYAGKPAKVHSIIKSKYRTMYKNVEEQTATADFRDEQLMCPYEESGMKKSCWTCHLPSQVWEALVRGSYGYNWLCKSCKYQLQHPK